VHDTVLVDHLTSWRPNGVPHKIVPRKLDNQAFWQLTKLLELESEANKSAICTVPQRTEPRLPLAGGGSHATTPLTFLAAGYAS
jgi:hypothetical protein